jgi:hydroxymethylpyrimidine pyrophosphatase-like HAD family hydrolase
MQGNAPDEIKAMARLVVADNDHDGIAEAVARLFIDDIPLRKDTPPV